jgi:hypothetical protein
MDTIAGLEELALLPGLDPVFLVQREEPAVTKGGPNVRGAQPKLLNASIR